jgi:hypothetical protein
MGFITKKIIYPNTINSEKKLWTKAFNKFGNLSDDYG